MSPNTTPSSPSTGTSDPSNNQTTTPLVPQDKIDALNNVGFVLGVADTLTQSAPEMSSVAEFSGETLGPAGFLLATAASGLDGYNAMNDYSSGKMDAGDLTCRVGKDSADVAVAAFATFGPQPEAGAIGAAYFIADKVIVPGVQQLAQDAQGMITAQIQIIYNWENPMNY